MYGFNDVYFTGFNSVVGFLGGRDGLGSIVDSSLRWACTHMSAGQSGH